LKEYFKMLIILYINMICFYPIYFMSDNAIFMILMATVKS
jgi:hypothetical protein